MKGNPLYYSLLHDWTKGLLKEESIISVFTHIRNIPYAIVPEWRDSDDIIRLMIAHNKGWCGPKHHLLAWMFEQLNVQTRYVYIPFRWQDQPFDFPEPITLLFPDLPSSIHLCTEVFLAGKWKLIDATWDPGLKKAGFPVNSWDGVSETIPAVRRNTHTPRLNLETCENPGVRIAFFHQLNEWLEKIRNADLE